MPKRRETADRLIVALDVDTPREAMKWVRRLRGTVRTFKVGKELFTAAGPAIVKKINSLGCRVFLDLKFFDIPNTMAKAVKAAISMEPFILNVHALSGPIAMKECAAAKGKNAPPHLIAVTILTSFTDSELARANIETPVEKTVVRLCGTALKAGMDGVVASPMEAKKLRAKYGKGFLIVTPGVRPAWAAKNDQKRVTTPGEAVRNGADYIVVGRPILSAPDPVKAAEMIIAEIEEA